MPELSWVRIAWLRHFLLRLRRRTVALELSGQRFQSLCGQPPDQFFGRQPFEAFLRGQPLEKEAGAGKPAHSAWFNKGPFRVARAVGQDSNPAMLPAGLESCPTARATPV